MWDRNVYLRPSRSCGRRTSQSQCFGAALNDIKEWYPNPEAVRFEIEEQNLNSYRLVIPYRISDYATTFVILLLDQVLDAKE